MENSVVTCHSEHVAGPQWGQRDPWCNRAVPQKDMLGTLVDCVRGCHPPGGDRRATKSEDLRHAARTPSGDESDV